MVVATGGKPSNFQRQTFIGIVFVSACSLLFVFREYQSIDDFTLEPSGTISISPPLSPNVISLSEGPSNDSNNGSNNNSNSIILGFPKRWGPCDPRKIKSYLPQGNLWIVSFAGWQENRKRGMKIMGKTMDGWLDGKARPLLFTEDNLPPSYYQKFNWSFTKPSHRGFWTWKPWILRNLTETGVFQLGDVVFWVDSDRKFTSNKRHFRTAICNMEHRNENYAGVFPFRRCYNHKESLFTKPETFERMGLNFTEWGSGEQLYAGSVGFHIGQDTLDFLKEWEDWGTVPVMFGDDKDFPSNPPPKDIYREHKNDQSVFSLMVRSRNMKAWPAPYYWRQDSGINQQCHKDFEDAGYCFFFENQQIPELCKPLEEWMEHLLPS